MASGCLPDLVFQLYNYIVVLSCFSWGHLCTYDFNYCHHQIADKAKQGTDVFAH